MRQAQERVVACGKYLASRASVNPSWADADSRLGRFVYEGTVRRPLISAAVEVASLSGDEVVWFPLPVVLVAAHLASGGRLVSHEAVRTLAELFGDLGMLSFCEQCLKMVFRRRRPAYQPQGSLYYCLPGEGFSFPSGHSSRAAFLAVSLVLGRLAPIAACRSRVDAALALAFAASVAASRVAKAKHYPVDVLGGALFGAALAALATHLGDETWSDVKVPCGVVMTLEVFAVLVVPRWRCEGSAIHGLIQLCWWISLAFGRSRLFINNPIFS